MNDKERDCVLMWDKMAIKPFLEYNIKDDYIEGFADLGKYGRTNDMATTAFVAMLTGLSFKWKQAIFFSFSKGPINEETLKVIISDILNAVEDTGFKVRSIVCDQGASNQKAIVLLGITENKPYIEIKNRKIFFNYDVPHLFKCFRNNLIKNDYVIDDYEFRGKRYAN